MSMKKNLRSNFENFMGILFVVFQKVETCDLLNLKGVKYHRPKIEQNIVP